MSEHELFPENSPPPPLWSRGEVVFAAAAATMMLGVFAPFPAFLLEFLWICVLSITIVSAYFFPKASSTADLKGFSAMLAGPALLRIGLVAALCVRLTGGQSAGLLIPATGKALTGTWPLAAALVCLIAAAALTMLLFGACQRIAAASERYKERIFPLKCVGIETDLKMGVITGRQARAMVEKVRTEAHLFANLTGTSLLMRAEGAIDIAAILACLIWPFLGVWTAAESGADRMAQAAAGAVGLAVFSLVPAVVSAMAGAHLAGKDSLTLRPAPTGQNAAGRTFTLVDQDTGRCEEVELLNPDFAGHAQPQEEADKEEHIAEFEPQRQPPLIETLTFSAGSARTYYRQLAGHVVNASAASRVILFAAREVQHLPVTVFVNTAIQLVQEGRTILLVDADTQRNALAQVFETDAERLADAIQNTGFEGLSLYGMSGSPERVKKTLEDAAQVYSCLLIYAPDLAVRGTLEATLCDVEPTAFFFGVEGTAQTQPVAAEMHYCRQLFLIPAAPLQTGSD